MLFEADCLVQAETALMRTAENSYLKIGEWLLQHGANSELRDMNVSTLP